MTPACACTCTCACLNLPLHAIQVRVKEALEQIEASGNPSSKIVIVGAGYAGVELATVVAERVGGRAQVQVVTPNADILDGCPEGQRLAARRTLTGLGAEVITGEGLCTPPS